MSDLSRGQVQPDGADDVPASMASLTDDILPALTARLRASSLGEIEVRTDGWRVRLRRKVTPAPATTMPNDGAEAARPQAAPPAGESGGARSPAVGYFTPTRDLAIGQPVRAGDSLGAVDMLGVVQDVPAPRDGIVSRLLAEAGQAVEYGQALVDIDPVGGSPDPSESATAAER